MALRVKVSARAASQIRKAAEWWVENRPSAPGAVRTDIGEALALLAQQPGIGTAYDQWRVCFRWTEAGAEDVEIVNYH